MVLIFEPRINAYFVKNSVFSELTKQPWLPECVKVRDLNMMRNLFWELCVAWRIAGFPGGASKRWWSDTVSILWCTLRNRKRISPKIKIDAMPIVTGIAAGDYLRVIAIHRITAPQRISFSAMAASVSDSSKPLGAWDAFGLRASGKQLTSSQPQRFTELSVCFRNDS